MIEKIVHYIVKLRLDGFLIMKFIKENFKVFVVILITMFLCLGGSCYALYICHAKDVSFTGDNTEFKAANVNEALDLLYENLDGKKNDIDYVHFYSSNIVTSGPAVYYTANITVPKGVKKSIY